MIIVTYKGQCPERGSKKAAGYDLKADVEVTISPRDTKLVKTGLKIQLPDNYEAQVRPRSGLALKKGLTVLNAPGTIDPDYTGEIGVIIHNTSDKYVKISKGDKIAQLVVSRFEEIDWMEVRGFKETERGEGGFGHTGMLQEDEPAG